MFQYKTDEELKHNISCVTQSLEDWAQHETIMMQDFMCMSQNKKFMAQNKKITENISQEITQFYKQKDRKSTRLNSSH